MNKFIFITLMAFLSMLKLEANNFRLYVNEVFTENEEVKVYIGGGFSYNYNENNQKQASFFLSLYAPQNPEELLFNVLKKEETSFLNDSLIANSKLEKNWSIKQKIESWQDITISLGKLSKGIHILEVVYRNEIARIPIIVSNYALVTQKRGKQTLAYVAEQESGEHKEAFKIYHWKENALQKPTKIEGGISIFEDIQNANYNDNTFFARQEDEFTVSDFYYYNYSYNDDYQGIVFSDRPAYRPGQQMYFQGILRKKEGYKLSVYTDTVSVFINDVQGQEIYKKQLLADEHGIFHDSLQIEEKFTLGEYTIRVEPGNVTNWNYYNQTITTFRVEEYKKPEFEVIVATEKARYVSGDTLTATIKASYFFGAPVKNATLNYRIVRELYYVPWYISSGYAWWYNEEDYGYSRNREVLINESTSLKEDGTFEIAYPTDADTDENYRYRIIADITDASRRSINGTATALVTATSFNIYASSENFYYKTDEKVKIRISTTDFSNKPVSKPFELTVKAYHNNEDEKEAIFKATGITDEKSGIDVQAFLLETSGYYQIEVRARDDNGKIANAVTSVYVLEEGRPAYDWWKDESVDIQLLVDKKQYESGDTVKAMVLAPNATDALLTLNGQEIVHKGIYRFNEQGVAFKEFILPLGSDVYGQMQISLVYVEGGDVYNRSASFVVIPKQQYLNVELSFDEDKYKPTTKATATIQVTDQQGNPVPDALVSLSTADESIYFLYPDETEDIRQAFYPNTTSVSTQFYANSFGKNKSSLLLDHQYLVNLLKTEKVFPDKYFFVPEGSNYFLSPGNLNKDAHKVSGYVVDKNGKLLEGVKIKSGSVTVKTNRWGYYELLNPEDTILSFSFKKAKVIFTDMHFFQQNAQGTYREISLNTKLDVLKKEKLTISFNNPMYFGRGRHLEMSQASMMMEGEVAFDAVEEIALDIEAEEQAPMERKSAAPSDEVAPVVRKNFKDAIYWNPKVITDKEGKAEVHITLPDNLTTWRTTAKVITKDSRVGQSLAKIVVKKDLLIRMETPRFIRTDDKLLIATNIHNYLKRDKRVRVALKANGLIVKGTSKNIVVEAGGEERVDWEVTANWPTDAVLTAEAITNEESDAKRVTVPVQATGLEVVKSHAISLKKEKTGKIEIFIPEEVDLNTVNLEISAAPSVAAALLSSLDQLIGYPYGCVEQTMSRFLPTLIVANTLQQLKGNYTTSISEEELQKMTTQGLKRLGELQHSDGGWGWWEKDETHPFMTAYVVNGLAMASKTGYDIPIAMLESGKQSLQDLLKQQDKIDATTYAYQVASAMQADIKGVWKNITLPQVDSLNAYQASLWLQAAQKAGDTQVTKLMRQQLEKLAIKDGDRCYWGGKKFYYNWQDDRVETTAHAVKALSAIDPNHELVAPAVQWLMQQRKGNGWHNTRQTAFIVLGLQKIIASELNPNFELQISTNGKNVFASNMDAESVFEKAKEIQLKGESFITSKAKSLSNPLNVLRHGKNEISILKKGNGTVYVNTGLTYFLQKDSKEKEALNNANLTIKRSYYTLFPTYNAEENIVYRKKPLSENGVISGGEVLVKVRIESKEELDYVLIEDPIPAGFEFIRDKNGYMIEGEEAFSGGSYYRSYYRWMYYAHEEYRDNRYAIVLTRLNEGEYEYTYLMKAQIPGNYEVNPTVVQLMYYPEKRAFSAFEQVNITDKD
ncbi:MAG: alpha-2-macroglobulin family protein [Bacteroidota bacterium]